MRNLRQKLPPLNSLVSFEAVARQMSFTRAAEELFLSQAAVSQQIRNLEGYLGFDLFMRTNRRISLTAKGKDLQHTVSQALYPLASGIQELRHTVSRDNAISIAADQSIASMWLMPRLPVFQQRFPEISVRLLATDSERECLGEDIQLAIIHGSGAWRGYRSQKLFEEEVFAVCSPAYRDGNALTDDPGALTGAVLLDLEDTHWDWINWRTWLSRLGIHLPAHHRRLQVNNYPLLIDAARNGQGVALGWKYLVDDDLCQGRLVRIGENSVVTDRGYYLVWPDHGRLSGPIARFRDWCRDL